MKDAVVTISVLNAYQVAIDGLRRWQDVIEQSLTYTTGTHTFDDVCSMVLTGRLQFYDFDDCFAIMELVTYPQSKDYHCFLAGGSIDGLLQCQDDIIAVAKNAGCSTVSLTGRKGWERAFKNAGWRSHSTSLFKRI
jgi:hypothetical protein